MMHSLSELEGYKIQATDGPIGQLRDLYFDDETWVVRYLVIDTGEWLTSRKVLIPPVSISHPDWPDKTLPITLSKQQIKSSPEIDTEMPVSRQLEMSNLRHYGYPHYWLDSGLGASANYPINTRPVDDGIRPRTAALFEPWQSDNDIHLRSCKAVEGYHIAAIDGEIGHISGLLVDEGSWAIRYLIADTSNWWIGHKLLIAPQWITEINWLKQTVSVDLVLQSLQEAPAYDSKIPFDHEMETKIERHYELYGHWPVGDR